MSLTGAPTSHRPGLFEAAPTAEDEAGVPTAGSSARPSPVRPRRRRLLRTLAVMAASALLAAGVVADLHVRSELHQVRSTLGTTRARLAQTLARVSSVEASLTSATSQRETLHVALEIVVSELSGAEANLTDAQSGLTTQQGDIAALDDCLGGVERALNQISVGDQSGAVTSMSGVSNSCQAAQGQGPGGPVSPFDFPDPDVLRVGATYDAYATNSATGNVQMMQSTDMVHWTVLGDALSHLASWARPGATWAPGVFERGGSFVLYYTASDRLTGKQCISVAVAGQPQGPFVDSTTSPVVCQTNLGGSIDPSPFVDTAGTPYLAWKSEGAGGRPPTIWSQQLDAAGTALVGRGPTALLQPGQSWQGGVVEGPAVLAWSGVYYLFYSANNWDSADYAIGVAVCRGPTGPCSEPLDGPIVGSQATLVGPGGPSLFTDTEGGLWLAFHAYLPSAVGYPHSRLLFLRQVTFNNGLPVVQAPT